MLKFFNFYITRFTNFIIFHDICELKIIFRFIGIERLCLSKPGNLSRRRYSTCLHNDQTNLIRNDMLETNFYTSNHFNNSDAHSDPTVT